MSDKPTDEVAQLRRELSEARTVLAELRRGLADALRIEHDDARPTAGLVQRVRNVRTERDGARLTRDEARDEAARMRPLVEAAEALRDLPPDYSNMSRAHATLRLFDAVASCRAALSAPVEAGATEPDREGAVSVTWDQLVAGVIVGVGGEHGPFVSQEQAERAADLIMRSARRTLAGPGATEPAPVWCEGEDEHLSRQPVASPNRSYWTSPETWCDPDCIECDGEGAPCCEPPVGPYVEWEAQP